MHTEFFRSVHSVRPDVATAKEVLEYEGKRRREDMRCVELLQLPGLPALCCLRPYGHTGVHLSQSSTIVRGQHVGVSWEAIHEIIETNLGAAPHNPTQVCGAGRPGGDVSSSDPPPPPAPLLHVVAAEGKEQRE
jgi:hypothetical protein